MPPVKVDGVDTHHVVLDPACNDRQTYCKAEQCFAQMHTSLTYTLHFHLSSADIWTTGPDPEFGVAGLQLSTSISCSRTDLVQCML